MTFVSQLETKQNIAFSDRFSASHLYFIGGARVESEPFENAQMEVTINPFISTRTNFVDAFTD